MLNNFCNFAPFFRVLVKINQHIEPCVLFVLLTRFN